VSGRREQRCKLCWQAHRVDDLPTSSSGRVADSLEPAEDQVEPELELVRVVVGGEGGDRWIGGALLRSLRALVVSPFVSQRLRPILAIANTQDLQFLTELIEAGKVTPVVDRTYSLSEVPDAIRYLNAGRARGKIVISVRGADRRSAQGSSVRTESHPVVYVH
jgi:hypothetical protein